MIKNQKLNVINLIIFAKVVLNLKNKIYIIYIFIIKKVLIKKVLIKIYFLKIAQVYLLIIVKKFVNI